jgi:hypothetical protein
MASSRLVRGDPKSIFKSPSSSGLHDEGQVAQAAQRASTPVVSVWGMYALITKNLTLPVTSWNVSTLGETIFTALISKS